MFVTQQRQARLERRKASSSRGATAESARHTAADGETAKRLTSHSHQEACPACEARPGTIARTVTRGDNQRVASTMRQVWT